jgi:hypothetical protein
MLRWSNDADHCAIRFRRVEVSSSAKTTLYYKVRDSVLEKATMPRNDKDASQEINQILIHDNLRLLCKKFDPSISVEDFWFECWSHFRWAGIKAVTGTADVDAHKRSSVFDDFHKLSNPAWDFPELPDGGSWGSEAKSYLSGEPPYDVTGLIRKRDKLKKTVRLARALDHLVRDFGPEKYLAGVFGALFFEQIKEPSTESVQAWHANLCRLIGGSNEITAFHLMMDLGLPCIKPDIVLTDMFYRLGWLNETSLSLGMSRSQISKQYRKPQVYWPMQKAALEVSREIIPLIGDNALREMDWMMVKYGQEPEPKRGICHNLDKTTPVETLITSI